MSDYDTKICSKCGIEKSFDEFYNSRSNKDGKCYFCKGCTKKHNKKYYIENKCRLDKYKKELDYKNKKILSKKRKKYYIENKEKKLDYGKEYRKTHKKEAVEYKNSYSKSKKYFEKFNKYEDVKWSKDGFIQVRCKKCNEYFSVSKQELDNRWLAINKFGMAEHNFYCSYKCKDTCDLFNKRVNKLEEFDSRELQGEWSKKVKERDNYKCQRCASKENLCAHHMEAHAVTYDSFDLHNGITLCENCHHEVHQLPGCTLQDIKKQKQNCEVN